MAPEFPLHVLSEYALLADGERGVMVGPRGDFVWMCAPRWDSDAVFSALIGGEGVYAVTPVDQPFVWGGYYEPRSLIWRSRWITTTQAIECREALAMPGDRHTAVALRRVEAIDGDTRVRVVFDPRAGFGRYKPSRVQHAGGIWTARCGPLYLRWSGMTGARPRSAAGSGRRSQFRPAAGWTWCWRSPTVRSPARRPAPIRPGPRPERPGTKQSRSCPARSPTGTPATRTPCCAG
jgi:alpha,alpha-trehalase